MVPADDVPETPTEAHDNLDSVLITHLDALDLDFWKVFNRRLAWWDSTRTKTWFKEKGYTLYSRMPNPHFGPSNFMFPVDPGEREISFPYSYTNVITDTEQPSLDASVGERGIVCYAQDTQGRHVAIKALADGSEEFRIIDHLRTEPLPLSIDEFNNVMPILDVLPCEGHWLAIMPRWGIYPLSPDFRNLQEALQFIHCLLKDLKSENVAVNLFTGFVDDHCGVGREKLRSEGKLTYALFDFSLATMFPSSVSLEHLTPVVPMLAPFLDKMTTRNIPGRFTAAEALEFFEQHVLDSPVVLGLGIPISRPIDRPLKHYDEYNRWKHLDPSFVQQWGTFREPPIPRHTMYLRRLCESSWGLRLVTWIRRISRFLRRKILPSHKMT
ncbi:hypothetical protein H0H93_014543 [Arthromyces matolae]|nr:hypothetical protein H0H93_014543 [Arthromyces matolae]